MTPGVGKVSRGLWPDVDLRAWRQKPGTVVCVSALPVIVHTESPVERVVTTSVAHQGLIEWSACLTPKAYASFFKRQAFFDYVCASKDARALWGMPDSDSSFRRLWGIADKSTPRSWRGGFPEDLLQLREGELADLFSGHRAAREEQRMEAVGAENVALEDMSEEELALLIFRNTLLDAARGDSDAAAQLKSFQSSFTTVLSSAMVASSEDMSSVSAEELVATVLDAALPDVVAALEARGFQVAKA